MSLDLLHLRSGDWPRFTKYFARGSQIPIIVVAGHGDALLERCVLDAGALFMLNKPIAGDTLLTAVRAALAGTEAQG